MAQRRGLAEELQGLARSLGSEQWKLPTENPGWSCRDVLTHLATGDWVMQEIVRSALAELDLGSVWDRIDVNAGNAERIAWGRAQTLDNLLDALRDQRRETERLWDQLGERHLQMVMPHWGGGTETVLEYLSGFQGHDRYHIGQIRAALCQRSEKAMGG